MLFLPVAKLMGQDGQDFIPRMRFEECVKKDDALAFPDTRKIALVCLLRCWRPCGTRPWPGDRLFPSGFRWFSSLYSQWVQIYEEGSDDDGI